MKFNGVVWVVTKFEIFGTRACPENIFVILNEKEMSEWIIKITAANARQNYDIKEVRSYSE